MTFSWTPEKEAVNIQKHHLSFSTAKFVFNDAERKERLDRKHSDNEDRWQTLGIIDDVVFVVYTERGEDCHLISARKANENERRVYYGTYKRNFDGWTKAN
jgi:uncharacterized DUF497 family protein